MNTVKKNVFIFDIDGTLSNHEGIRTPYEEHKVHIDLPIEPVWKILACIIVFYKIIFVSGRTEGCREKTIEWLLYYMRLYCPLVLDNFIPELYMRKIGDNRKDSIVKKEIYDEFITPHYNIIGVFDDRMQVCRMLYENGIFCFNVNQGLKEF